jgi:hypothetical protein
MEEYVIDIEDISSDSLISKIYSLWGRRAEIRNLLKDRTTHMEKGALLNVELIGRLNITLA